MHSPQLAVELVTKGLPCLRLFNDNDKEEVKVYEMFADAFFVMQVRPAHCLLRQYKDADTQA